MDQSTGFTGISVSASSGLVAPDYALLTADGRLETASPKLISLLEDPEFGQPLLKLLQPAALGAQDTACAEPVSKTLKHDGQIYDVAWIRMADGRWLVSLVENPERLGDAPAEKDGLTGLFARTALAACAQDIREKARQDDLQVFCLYIDLDRFKQVNDTLGHAAGDKLLVKAAKRLLGCIRESDKAVRLGGDEFLVLGATRDPKSTTEDIAGRVLDYLARPYLIDGNQAVIGTSIGAAILQPDDNLETLLRQADLALYQSKRSGRGCLSYYDKAMEDAAHTRRNLDIALRQALALNAFEVHYQPQYSISDGSVSGFEALLRLRETDGSLRDARSFLQLAEETQLIVRVGKFVLAEAIEAATTWPEHVHVSINISQVELQHGNVAETIAYLLQEHSLAPGRLHIEVKETALAQNDQACIDALRDLHALGVSLVVDKLGDDDSAVEHLFSTPFSCVKINKSRLSSLSTAKEQAKATALVELAKAAGARVIADTVETPEQLAFAREIGCETAQGFLFEEPISLEATRDMVMKQRSDAGKVGVS